MKKIILALMLLMPLSACSDKFDAGKTNSQLKGQWLHRDLGTITYKYVFTEDFTMSSWYHLEGNLLPNHVDVKYTLVEDRINLSSGGSMEYKMNSGLLYLNIGGSWIGFARN